MFVLPSAAHDFARTLEKEEAGSPNVVGAVALAEAINVLTSVGMQTIAEHEQSLLEYAFPKLKKNHPTRQACAAMS